MEVNSNLPWYPHDYLTGCIAARSMQGTASQLEPMTNYVSNASAPSMDLTLFVQYYLRPTSQVTVVTFLG